MGTIAFTKVHECHKISVITVKIACFIGNPYFNLFNTHSGCNVWRRSKPGVIVFPEKMGEEKMPVGIVFIDIHFKFVNLCTALDINNSRFASLMAKYICNGELSELELGFQT